MPFTVNVGPYQGGQMLAQAGQNLGQGILGGVVNYMEGQKDLANDQVLLDFYSKQGMVTPDILDKYQRGSHSGKTGIIAGLTRQFAEQQQQAQEKRLTAAQAEIAKYHQASLANEATRIKMAQAEQNFTPRPPMQFATPPPELSGVQGPPTDEEAARPKITMIETSPGKWKEPDVAEGGGTFIPPGQSIPVRDPDTNKVVAHQIRTGPKTSVVLPSEEVATLKDEQGNTIGYRAGKSVKFGTGEKAYTPGQIASAFKNFGVTGADISDPTKHHDLNIHGDDAQPGEDVVAVGIDTENGRRNVPVDTFNNLKSYVTGGESQLKRSKDMPKAETKTTPQADRVKVADKNGKVFTVPASQLDQAVAQGYKKL